MNFKTLDLLNLDELKNLHKMDMPTQKAKLLFSKLKNYLLIDEISNTMYRLNKNNYYDKFEINEDKIISIVCQYIENSIENIPKISRKFECLCSEYNVKGFYRQLISVFATNEIKMDDSNINKIHLINGYIDLSDLSFHEREIGVDFVSIVNNKTYSAPIPKVEVIEEKKEFVKVKQGIDVNDKLDVEKVVKESKINKEKDIDRIEKAFSPKVQLAIAVEKVVKESKMKKSKIKSDEHFDKLFDRKKDSQGNIYTQFGELDLIAMSF